MNATKHLRIHGVVQGVGYRAALAREAERLRLTGWVRNRADGTVEAIVQGPHADVESLIAWARQGPRAARVERVDCSDGEGEFPGFAVLSSA